MLPGLSISPVFAVFPGMCTYHAKMGLHAGVIRDIQDFVVDIRRSFRRLQFISRVVFKTTVPHIPVMSKPKTGKKHYPHWHQFPLHRFRPLPSFCVTAARESQVAFSGPYSWTAAIVNIFRSCSTSQKVYIPHQNPISCWKHRRLCLSHQSLRRSHHSPCWS